MLPASASACECKKPFFQRAIAASSFSSTGSARDDAREEEGEREGGRDLGRKGGGEDKNVLYVAVAEPLICLPASTGALS